MRRRDSAEPVEVDEESVFEMFKASKASTDVAGPGTGLGLAVA
jgi:K+-sensing histidine kinase KdpD